MEPSKEAEHYTFGPCDYIFGPYGGEIPLPAEAGGEKGVFSPPPLPLLSLVDFKPYVPKSDSNVPLPAEPPLPKPIKPFAEVVIPEVSSDAMWLSRSSYHVLVSKEEIPDETILEHLERALNASNIKVAIRRNFSTYQCEFEVHFNSSGEHTDGRFKVYIAGDDYVIQMDRRCGDGLMLCRLFSDVTDILMDSFTVKYRDGTMYEKSAIRIARGPRFNDNIGSGNEEHVDDSIQWTMEQVKSPYVDISHQALISLVHIIRSSVRKNPDAFLRHDVLKVLTDKLYIRDEDCNLAAMTAVHALSEGGGAVMHEAILHQGTFFSLADACTLQKKGPFSDDPFYHGLMDRTTAEEKVGSCHPGTFLAYTDKDNKVNIACLESLEGDGKSYHMEKKFSHEEVIFIPETKRYCTISSPTRTFLSLSALVGGGGNDKWTTPLMKSIKSLLIKREALKALANICQTKSVVEEMKKFNVLIRMRDAYEAVEGDDVVRRVAWEGLNNARDS